MLKTGLRIAAALGVALCAAAQPVSAQRAQRDVPSDPERFRLGVTVLLEDQLSLVRGRRIGLVVEAVSRDERGERTDELLKRDARLRTARATVAAVWRVDDAPAGSIAVNPGLLPRLVAAADSALAGAQVIVVDVVDLGVRSGRAQGIVLAALSVAARRGLAVIVLDRPNPLTGEHAEGPAPDSLDGASDGVYGLPARHGMTIGEIARWFNESGSVGAALTVVPVRGWRRSHWPPQRGAVAGRNGVATTEQLILLGAFAPLAGTNLYVAPGASRTEVRIGARWLDAHAIANALKDRVMPGLEFSAGRNGFGAAAEQGNLMPSVRVSLVDRDRGSGARALAAVLAQIRKAHGADLKVADATLDALSGSPAFRRGIISGDDSDAVIDRDLAAVVDFRRRTRAHLLYR